MKKIIKGTIAVLILLYAESTFAIGNNHRNGNAGGTENKAAFQFTLVPPLGTNGIHAGKYSNAISVNLIGGLSENERFFTLSGISSVIKGDATGLQTAGFSNHIGNDGILVSNSIRLRANVPGYGIGLGNLCQQYAIYGKSMEILRRHDEFAVRLPYIE